jgi:hypothetical protein
MVRVGAGEDGRSQRDGRAWRDEQRAFVEAYAGRRVGAERRPVKILWWTDAPAQGPDVLGVVARLWTGRRARPAQEQTFVALFDATDPVGARPFLVVRTGPDTFGQPSGRSTGTAVGAAEPDGVLLIETRRGQVIPAEPPGLPGDAAPAWSEVDPPM